MNSSEQDRTERAPREGNVEADRRYRSDAREFVRNHDVEKTARTLRHLPRPRLRR